MPRKKQSEEEDLDLNEDLNLDEELDDTDDIELDADDTDIEEPSVDDLKAMEGMEEFDDLLENKSSGRGRGRKSSFDDEDEDAGGFDEFGSGDYDDISDDSSYEDDY